MRTGRSAIRNRSSRTRALSPPGVDQAGVVMLTRISCTSTSQSLAIRPAGWVLTRGALLTAEFCHDHESSRISAI
jgi:hypothetical protein